MSDLPATLGTTREALRAVACYALSPARKARTGRIGLRSTGDGFGTPPFDDGSRFVVRGDRIAVEPGEGVPITTVRAAAEFLGIEPSEDPGVGHDLPPYEPDADLVVDAEASLVLGVWYAFGQRCLDALRAGLDGAEMSEAQLWPEHFDLAVTVELAGGPRVNVGFSPGDAGHDRPYVYVGPFDTAGLTGEYWNAPFGAALGWDDLQAGGDPEGAALSFVRRGLDLLA